MLCLVFALFLQDASPEAIERWVKDLGNEEFKVREEAEKNLRAAGKPVLPYLEKALQSEDLEIRERAESIRKSVTGEKSTQVEDPKPHARRQAPEGGGANLQFSVVVRAAGDDPYELKMGPDGVELKKDGKTYSATSQEEFRKNYPDLYEKYVKSNVGGVRVQVRPNRVEKPKRDPIEDPFFGLDENWAKQLEDLNRMLEDLHKAIQKQDEDLEGWLDDWMKKFEAERKQLDKARKEFADNFRKRWEEGAKGNDKVESVDPAGGRLGLLFDVVDETLRAKHKLADNEGVVVVKVIEDTIAARLGVKPGDVITKVGETPIGNALQARSELWKALKTDELAVEVVRDGERKSLKAKSSTLRD